MGKLRAVFRLYSNILCYPLPALRPLRFSILLRLAEGYRLMHYNLRLLEPGYECCA